MNRIDSEIIGATREYKDLKKELEKETKKNKSIPPKKKKKVSKKTPVYKLDPEVIGATREYKDLKKELEKAKQKKKSKKPSTPKLDPEVIGATREYKNLKKEVQKETKKKVIKKQSKKSKKIKIIFALGGILTGTCIPLYVMARNNSTLVSLPVITPVLVLSILLFIYGFISLILKKPVKRKSIKKPVNILLLCIICGYLLLTSGLTILLYGSYGVKDWIINKALSSMNYQHIAYYFYDNITINQFASKMNYEETSTVYEDLLSFDEIEWNKPVYANQYDEQILTKGDNDLYKVIPIEGTIEQTSYHYSGFLVAIYDPSKVKLAVSSGVGEDESAYGERLSVMATRENAVIAMNAGGFYDPDWRSNGGIPHGPLIKDGVLLTNFRKYPAGGGIVGFNQKNELVLKNMTGEQAVEEGIRDAVDWGPYLIVNGINQITNPTYTWALARTAIGQRKDGIVLFLVIDGLQSHSKGATFYQMAKIMQTYGAYNAANLDGGTSATLWEKGEFLNNPFNGERTTYRRLPNAWIVVE